MKLFVIYLCTLSFCVFAIKEARGLTLNEVQVPHMVVIDDENTEPIKLDCLYELNEDPTYLVVKWFIDDKGIYQWIRGQQPSVFPYFKDHVGEIEPTHEEPNHKYRGLTLINPSIELSGTYKCAVQTNNDSKSKEAELNIIDISNYTMKFENHLVQNETHLECSVENVYPQPRIYLESEDDTLIHTTASNISRRDNDYFDGWVTAVADDDEDSFSCTILFDGLPFNLTANVLSGDSTRNVPFSWALILITLYSLV